MSNSEPGTPVYQQFPSITKTQNQPAPPGSEQLPPIAKQLLLLGMNPAGFSPEAIEPITAPDTENEAWFSVLNNLQNNLQLPEILVVAGPS